MKTAALEGTTRLLDLSQLDDSGLDGIEVSTEDSVTSEIQLPSGADRTSMVEIPAGIRGPDANETTGLSPLLGAPDVSDASATSLIAVPGALQARVPLEAVGPPGGNSDPDTTRPLTVASSGTNAVLPARGVLAGLVLAASAVGLVGMILFQSAITVAQPTREELMLIYPYGLEGAKGKPGANAVTFTFAHPVSCQQFGESDCLMYEVAAPRFFEVMIVKRSGMGWTRLTQKL